MDQVVRHALELDAGGDKTTMKQDSIDATSRSIEQPDTLVQWIRIDAWGFIASAS